MRLRHLMACASIVAAMLSTTAAAQLRVSTAPSRIPLSAGWAIQSSARAPATGEAISTVGYQTDTWIATTVPTTVLAALVANHAYPDPNVGMNMRTIPGATYPIASNFSRIAMPQDSPFRPSWWFRTEFQLVSVLDGQHLALHFDGINYRANVWLNGHQIAKNTDVAGAYRLYEFDITPFARVGQTNALAVEIEAPGAEDLAMTFVDWMPQPPDKSMGLWRPVYITTSGPVALRDPHIVTHVDTATLRRADLSISTEVRNLSAASVSGTVRATIDQIRLTQPVSLAPHETKLVRFEPAQFAPLHVENPRLWWPAEMGTPNLYDLNLAFDVRGAVSDEQTVRFGMREITSEFTPQGGRLFRINGKRLLIRGGGWAPDMLLRASPQRQEDEIKYVRDLHLNTIRLEGKHEDENFYDLTDRYGILVMEGWSCCDQWELWSKWKPQDTVIAAQSERDQIRRLRNRASLLVWLNGSDNPPPAKIESMYVSIMKEYEWQNPVLSSASGKRASTGPSGVKMTGPYDWVPPAYWIAADTLGGARGFNTETSPGAAIPPIESLRLFLPADHLWPIDSVWGYHVGLGQFTQLKPFNDALAARYGAFATLDDYVMKAQLATYEGERAMFEAYRRNAYVSTGIIQWMLNNGWPSLFWHLYDYYLRPAGGYFGAKKANEPVHVLLSVADRSVYAVNSTRALVPRARLAVRAYGLDLAPLYTRDTTITIAADSSTRLFVVPPIAAPAPTYFVDLRLTRADGTELSRNFYWVSSKADQLDLSKSTWFMTPTTSVADFTALKALPPATVTSAIVRTERSGTDEVAHVTVRNTGTSLAFFLRLKLTSGASGDEILPVRWEDNYISLLPGESRTLTATYRAADRGSAAPALGVSGWNVR